MPKVYGELSEPAESRALPIMPELRDAVPTDFTYDLTTDLGQLRLTIGDTSSTAGAGVKPNGSYLTDDELQYCLDEENTVELAAARACDILATMWATYADLTVGPRSEKLSQIADRYAERANALRGAALVTGYVSMGFAQVDS